MTSKVARRSPNLADNDRLDWQYEEGLDYANIPDCIEIMSVFSPIYPRCTCHSEKKRSDHLR